jgi:hypothetical protein
MQLKNYGTITQKKADNLSIIFHPHPTSPIWGEELYLPYPGGRD